MEGHITLNRVERYQHFFYLLLLLMVALVVLYFVFLRNYPSPFSNKLSYEMQMLDQKNKFKKFDEAINPFIKKTFEKIDVLPLKNMQPFTESDIKTSINEIATALNTDNVFDIRKESYLQIAQFYKIYFEDKQIAGKKADNILLFEKQFTECSIGFKDKEQQLAQKQAAVSARNN